MERHPDADEVGRKGVGWKRSDGESGESRGESVNAHNQSYVRLEGRARF